KLRRGASRPGQFAILFQGAPVTFTPEETDASSEQARVIGLRAGRLHRIGGRTRTTADSTRCAEQHACRLENADVREGRGADPLQELRDLPSPRRDRTDVAHQLQRRPSVGALDWAEGIERSD